MKTFPLKLDQKMKQILKQVSNPHMSKHIRGLIAEDFENIDIKINGLLVIVRYKNDKVLELRTAKDKAESKMLYKQLKEKYSL